MGGPGTIHARAHDRDPGRRQLAPEGRHARLQQPPAAPRARAPRQRRQRPRRRHGAQQRRPGHPRRHGADGLGRDAGAGGTVGGSGHPGQPQSLRCRCGGRACGPGAPPWPTTGRAARQRPRDQVARRNSRRPSRAEPPAGAHLAAVRPPGGCRLRGPCDRKGVAPLALAAPERAGPRARVWRLGRGGCAPRARRPAPVGAAPAAPRAGQLVGA